MRATTNGFANVLTQCADVGALAATHDDANSGSGPVIMSNGHLHLMDQNMTWLALDYFAGSGVFVEGLAVFFQR